ncbi:MAG: shikimate kinase [Methylocystaceae bacterium]
MDKNIVLIGFMGAGKTSVGRTIAQKLGWSFIDTDQEIERLTSLPVHEIFRRYGEVRFRSEERLLASKLLVRKHMVVATGGGMVQHSDNVELLKQNGTMVWLHVTPEMVLRRVGRRTVDRPLLRGKLNVEDITELLKAREAIYTQVADIVVENENRSLDELAREIINRCQEHESQNHENIKQD